MKAPAVIASIERNKSYTKNEKHLFVLFCEIFAGNFEKLDEFMSNNFYASAVSIDGYGFWAISNKDDKRIAISEDGETITVSEGFVDDELSLLPSDRRLVFLKEGSHYRFLGVYEAKISKGSRTYLLKEDCYAY